MSTVDLRLGDCLEILPTLAAGSVGMIFADPPYLDGRHWAFILPQLVKITDNIVVTPGKYESFSWIRKKKPSYEYAWESHSQSMGGRACMHIGWEPILAYHYPHR